MSRRRSRPTLALVSGPTPCGDAPEDVPLATAGRGIFQLDCAGDLTRLIARTSRGVVIAELVVDRHTSWSLDDVHDGIAFLQRHLDRVDPNVPLRLVGADR